jgi:hypothetical protein
MRHPLSRAIFFIGGIATALVALYTTSEPVRNFIDWMIDRVQDLIGVWSGLPGPIQLAVLAIGALHLLRGPLSGTVTAIKGMLDTMALKFMYAKDQAALMATGMSNMASPKGAITAARTGFGKMVSFLGGPWGLAIGGAVIGLGYLVEALDKSNQYAKEAEGFQRGLAAALRDSNGAIDDSVRAVAAQTAADTNAGGKNLLEWAREVGFSLPRVTDALLGNKTAAEELDRALAIYQDRENALARDGGPMAATHARNAGAAADARRALEQLLPTMANTTQGNRDLEAATGDTADEQARLDEMVTRANEALAIQNQQMLTMTEASMAFERSTSDLAEAHQAVADALANEGAGSQAYTDALARLEEQSYNTATAAGRVAEARHSDAEGAELQLWNNAALLENLRQQEAKYGELPPRLAELKASLEANVPAAFQAATQFENLGLKINQVPNEKTVIVDSSTTQTQLDRLRDLGYRITELPDGSYEVMAETTAAEDALAELTQDRTVSIFAEAKWASINNRRNRENQDFADSKNLPPLPRASGGPVYGPGGPTSDSILARLSNGEYVVRAASVQKYGVQFLEAVNAGRFATGGLVGRIIPGFAGGGLAASWGGTINMTGGDTNPLAQIWFEAIGAINSAASQGSSVIAGHFANLRNSVKGTLTGLRGEASGIWSGLMNFMTPSTRGMQGSVGGIIQNLRTDVTGKFGALGSTVRTLWDQMGSAVRGQTSQTATHNGSVFGTMRTSLGGLFGGLTSNLATLWSGMGGSVRGQTSTTANHNNTTFGNMRTTISGVFTDTISRVKGTWNQIAGITQKPINFVINSVLNNGLFKAFNGIIGTLGLPKSWRIPTAAPVPNARLAAGGRVPGWSPHDRADNIPAMLTANEYVLPVGATRKLRRRIGDEGLEMLRQGALPAFASGGLVAFGRRLQSMGARVAEHPAFGGVAPVHGTNSLHYSGNAIDVNTRAGTSALEQRELAPMANLARSLGFRVIFMAPGHYNHLHVDTGRGGSIGGSAPSGGSGAAVSAPAWYDLFGTATGVLKKLQESITGPADEVDKRYGKSTLSNVLEAMPAKALGWIWGKAKDTISGLFTGVLDNLQSHVGAIVGAFSGSGTPVEATVKSVADKYGWGSGNEWNALARLIQKESSFKPTAQNPTSTAYGLFQFLNSTWAGVGGYKTDNPGLQTEFGLRYIKSRYGTPSQALAFHLKNNWYSEGGEVTADGAKAEAPTLYDTGGWLPPGLTTVMNATGRPEPILTGDQWDALLQTGSGDGEGIKHLHIHEVATNIEEAIGAVNHNVRVLSHGGRYAARGDED